jgi:hypothetical protein
MAQSLTPTTERERNLETFTLIWLDASVNVSEHCRSTQQQLRRIIDYLILFDDVRACLTYIRNQSNTSRIIVITSGRFGRIIVPQLIESRQIVSIYVYCADRKANLEWSISYNKVITFHG